MLYTLNIYNKIFLREKKKNLWIPIIFNGSDLELNKEDGRGVYVDKENIKALQAILEKMFR
jgi:predicted RNA-binding protein YlxR (DUF448 family)